MRLIKPLIQGPSHRSCRSDSGPFSDQFGGSPANEQLRGSVDDILVQGRALSPDEIGIAVRKGTQAFATPPKN